MTEKPHTYSSILSLEKCHAPLLLKPGQLKIGVSRPPYPLRNEDEMCYMNAVLQVLSSCSRITDWVDRNPSKSIHLDAPCFPRHRQAEFGKCIVRAIEDLKGGIHEDSSTISDHKVLHSDESTQSIKSFQFVPTCKTGTEQHIYSEPPKAVNRIVDGSIFLFEPLNALRTDNVCSFIDGCGPQGSGDFLYLAYETISDGYILSSLIKGLADSEKKDFSSLVKVKIQMRQKCIHCEATRTETLTRGIIYIPAILDRPFVDCIQAKIYGFMEESFRFRRSSCPNVVTDAIEKEGSRIECMQCFNSGLEIRTPVSVYLPPVLSICVDPLAKDIQELKHKQKFAMSIPLQMTARTVEDPGQQPLNKDYVLFAVVSYIGVSSNWNDGHFITYVRAEVPSDGSVWYRCDDESIETIRSGDSRTFAPEDCHEFEKPSLIFYQATG